MKRQRVALMITLVLTASSSAQDQDALTKSLKEADLVFTAKISKVNPLGQTNSIPPSTFGNVVFKEPKALRGMVPIAATFNYSFREGATKNLELMSKDTVLVAVKQMGVSAIVPATEVKLALVKKLLEK